MRRYGRSMADNPALRARMDELGLSQDELARQMNDALAKITGRQGDFSDRTVRNLLNGTTRRPIGRTVIALEAVFQCRADELGFSTSRTKERPPESPVRRRTFLTSTTGTAAATALPALTAPRQIGMSDVHRLQADIDRLAMVDDRDGGHITLERAALAGARHALDLQQLSASQRVRQRLFGIAADYTAWAAWSCIDVRALDRAQLHLDRAMTLSGLAQDSIAQLRVWNSIAMLAHQQRHHHDAVAAGQAAQTLPVTRRDPLFASLAYARTAVGHSNAGHRQAALRSLGRAEELLSKAGPTPRPSWVAFYGPAELHGMTAIVHERLGMSASAEASSHRALSTIPERFRRNRALMKVRLALAQLHQGDVELSSATAESVFDIMDGVEIPGRMRTLLGDYHRDLLGRARSSAQTQEWTDRLRTKWS